MSRPLLSIIIPTKNKQEYALAAVESVFRLHDNIDQIELIVRDCSDNDNLRGLLKNKFSVTSNLIYIYDKTKPSMTENWDLAFSKATGLFVLGIGDDDAVLSNVISVVEYMQRHNLDCIRQPMAHYFWPGAFLGSYNCEKAVFPKKMCGDVWKVDIEKSYNAKIVSCGFGYTHELPNVYHAIIKNSILQKHKEACGRIFNGTSIDAYASFAFSKYTKNMAVLDFPFSIHGVCPTSNSNRLIQRNMKAYKLHFDEFSNLDFPPFLPSVLSSEVSISESMICALRDTNQECKIKLMNLAYVYGRTAAMNLNRVHSLKKEYDKFQGPDDFKFGFYSSFTHFFLQRTKQSITSRSLNAILKLFPSLTRHIFKYFGNSKRLNCQNIQDAYVEIEQVLPSAIKEPLELQSDYCFLKSQKSK